jgi:hypothetical protein
MAGIWRFYLPAELSIASIRALGDPSSNTRRFDMVSESREQLVLIPANGVTLEGALMVPTGAQGVVVFSHGSGSSRHSPRNTFVAQILQSAGLGTLLFDLLTREEDATYKTRFDIDLLTRRL